MFISLFPWSSGTDKILINYSQESLCDKQKKCDELDLIFVSHSLNEYECPIKKNMYFNCGTAPAWVQVPFKPEFFTGFLFPTA